MPAALPAKGGSAGRGMLIREGIPREEANDEDLLIAMSEELFAHSADGGVLLMKPIFQIAHLDEDLLIFQLHAGSCAGAEDLTCSMAQAHSRLRTFLEEWVELRSSPLEAQGGCCAYPSWLKPQDLQWTCAALP